MALHLTLWKFISPPQTSFRCFCKEQLSTTFSLDYLQQKVIAYWKAELQNNNLSQFLVFLHVPEDQVLQIVDDSFSPLGGLVSYEFTTQTLIIKMPKKAHEVAKAQFAYLLNKKVWSVESVWCFGDDCIYNKETWRLAQGTGYFVGTNTVINTTTTALINWIINGRL